MIAAALTALVMVGLLGACSGGSSKSDLAAQDRQVEISNQLNAIHTQYLAAQRRLARARQVVARVRTATVVETRTTSRTIVRTRRAARPSDAFDALCSPVRPRAKAGPQRRAQQRLERRRRQALYYLNLSCPQAGA